ncbi:UL36 very large tegument protein [Streptomyces vilmorinianum]|uniref:UL36 very large tegument protein n=1 Tax=Streptomyces vilmorinianum TaxID=3051092 RepID=UPI001586DCDB|nr:UL36 very large tegument protein [Streptomyces vilmorinianum]
MTVYQLPVEVGAFARYLRELATRLRPGEGWYGVFASRDPEGLRACFDGTEILPWDVVESLLQDLGEPAVGPQAARARALYDAAAAAHDRRPGGAEALRERLAAMERERRYAETRSQELGAQLRAAPASPDAARLNGELAWTQDDHARATARIAELTSRLAALGADDDPAPVPVPAHAPPPPPAPAPPKRRPRGARYAWLDEAEEVQEAVPVPDLPVAGAAPRGARFGGSEAPAAPAPRTVPREVAAEAARAAGNAVYALQRLRAQGRSGEAHALLCEAVAGPPAWLPALAAELHRVGLGADWATLLWEAASLPPGRLAAVAGALADAGRSADCDQLLRQGVARPVEELAGACAALHAEDHHREAHALLTAFVRVRTPEDAAHLAAADPHGLVPQLLAAARTVSPARERDLLHALRVGGLAGA